MEQVNMIEVEKRIGYWEHVLGKIDRHMLKEQSNRVDIRRKLAHLNSLRYKNELVL